MVPPYWGLSDGVGGDVVVVGGGFVVVVPVVVVVVVVPPQAVRISVAVSSQANINPKTFFFNCTSSFPSVPLVYMEYP